MKKVLFTATVDSHILQFHLPFLKLFKENGYEVHVATNGKEDIPYCDYKHTIPFERSPFKLNNIKAIIQLKKIIDTEKFNIIHTHTPMGSVVTRLAAKNARKKYHTRVIYTAHGLHFFKGAPLKNWILFYPIEKYLSKYTDTLILINHEDFDLCKRKFKKCMDIQYVPGVGIDTQKYSSNLTKKEKDAIKEKMNLNKDDVVLTCIARLDKNKNQGFLINVMNDINKINPKIKLLLVGPDENHKIYHELVENQKLNDCIYFTGKRTDIPEILSISDIVLSASYREGLPVNIMEAMASGLPVVALNCRGMEDLITNGENGFIVQRDNKNVKEEYIKCIFNILDNSVFYSKISKLNLKKCKNFDLENIINMMHKIYFKKKKILHILASNSYSGAENVVCTIIENLKEEYDFIYCSPEGKISDVLIKKSIKYIPIKKLSYKNLKDVVVKYNPDIIHAHDYKASCYSALIKNYIIISHIHQNSIKMRKRNFLTILYKILSKNFYQIIYVSNSALNDYFYKKSVLNKSIILPNVIDINQVNKKSEEFKINNKYDMIFLGRLSMPKDPKRLIIIMKKLLEINKNYKLAIIGNGEEKENVEYMIKEYNLENNIEMLGYQTNPYPYLKSGKILVMTSIYEGTPMAALEAMNFGLVIVSTPVDGLRNIIRNGYNGFLYNDNDKIVECINDLLNHKERINELSKNSKAFFRNYNDLNKYCNTIKKIYK